MTPTVLIGDPEPERAERISVACAGRGLDCTAVGDGAKLLEAALADPPAALAVHVDLPLIDGVRLAEILEANPRTHRVGVVLLGDPQQTPLVAGRPVTAAVDAESVARRLQALLVGDPAREAPGEAGEKEGRVEGELGQLGLPDLLQLFHESRRTGSVEIVQERGQDPPDVGRVYLREGEIVQAVVGLLEGEKALFRLLGWDRGRFRFQPSPVTIAPRIDTPTRALLREGERQLAERERLAVDLPPLDAQVTLVVQRSRLPNVIHPLTQEVLVVLELYSRVRDVVDHCSHPDYQVLRTLQTLIERGLVELRREPALAQSASDGRLFSSRHAARLREWLAPSQLRGSVPPDAKLLVLSPDPGTTRAFARLLERLPGVELDGAAVSPEADSLFRLGRLAVDAELGIELVHVPVAERFAPLWPVAGHGALGALLPVAAPVERGAAAVRAVARALRSLPGARVFYLLLLEGAERGAPEALRENMALLDDGPVFFVPLENDEKAAILLREMFGRVLP